MTDRFNVAAALLAVAEASPRATALRIRAEAERRDWSYGELAAAVRRFAGALSQVPIAEEQRILIALPDCAELVMAFLGAIWAGAVPVVVNPALRADDYAFFVADTRAKLVIGAAQSIGALEKAIDSVASAHSVELWTVASGGKGVLWDAVRGAMEAVEPFPADRDDAAFWLYSSGTTGRPKGTIHRHADILHAVDSYGRHILALTANDVVYSTSRMFFAYGLGASLYFPLAAGASSVLSPEPFDASRSWRLIEKERPSLLFAVPSVYRAMLDLADPDANILASVRLCLSAGEGLPESLFEQWRRRFQLEIIDGVGSTEALHVYLSNRPGACRPGTLGTPVPGYDVRIVDEAGRDTARGEAGMMLVRGPSLAAGYWHRREATERAFLGEWFVTGDRAVQDEDGLYRVLGRVDDMIKVSGQWVSPSDVEEAIRSVEGVVDCGVVGVPDAAGLTELVACIVAAGQDASGVAASVEARCAERMPRYKRPRRVIVVASLPRTPTGKLQRFRLREMMQYARREEPV
jgi:benzoate-CoA ligase family protein